MKRNDIMIAEGSSFRRRVFVVMPFGKKDVPRKPRADLPPGAKEQNERLQVDFDAVYEKLFQPSFVETRRFPVIQLPEPTYSAE